MVRSSRKVRVAGFAAMSSAIAANGSAVAVWALRHPGFFAAASWAGVSLSAVAWIPATASARAALAAALAGRYAPVWKLPLRSFIAAVVGGCSLTGGAGSAAGSAIGALIYGMTMQCIVYAGWDQNWFRFFLGSMLLLAVLLTMNVKRLSAQRSI